MFTARCHIDERLTKVTTVKGMLVGKCNPDQEHKVRHVEELVWVLPARDVRKKLVEETREEKRQKLLVDGEGTNDDLMDLDIEGA